MPLLDFHFNSKLGSFGPNWSPFSRPGIKLREQRFSPERAIKPESLWIHNGLIPIIKDRNMRALDPVSDLPFSLLSRPKLSVNRRNLVRPVRQSLPRFLQLIHRGCRLYPV